MTTEALRQQLARLSDVQAALDALKIDLTIQLRNSQKCTDETDTATTGIWPHSGLLSVS